MKILKLNEWLCESIQLDEQTIDSLILFIYGYDKNDDSTQEEYEEIKEETEDPSRKKEFFDFYNGLLKYGIDLNRDTYHYICLMDLKNRDNEMSKIKNPIIKKFTQTVADSCFDDKYEFKSVQDMINNGLMPEQISVLGTITFEIDYGKDINYIVCSCDNELFVIADGIDTDNVGFFVNNKKQ